MTDANTDVRASLEKLSGIAVVYQHPKDFTELPAVSYYTLSERGDFAADNKRADKKSTVQLDFWGTYPKQCADFAAQAYTVLTNDGWYHEYEADVPNPDKTIYHRTARYSKTFTI